MKRIKNVGDSSMNYINIKTVMEPIKTALNVNSLDLIAYLWTSFIVLRVIKLKLQIFLHTWLDDTIWSIYSGALLVRSSISDRVFSFDWMTENDIWFKISSWNRNSYNILKKQSMSVTSLERERERENKNKNKFNFGNGMSERNLMS